MKSYDEECLEDLFNGFNYFLKLHNVRKPLLMIHESLNDTVPIQSYDLTPIFRKIFIHCFDKYFNIEMHGKLTVTKSIMHEDFVKLFGRPRIIIESYINDSAIIRKDITEEMCNFYVDVVSFIVNFRKRNKIDIMSIIGDNNGIY